MKRVALILNLNKQYDRSIVGGIARFTKENPEWSLYIEDDPKLKIPDLKNWNGQGIIADLDDKKVCEAIQPLNIPIVGLGGGFLNTNLQIPYVYTDNQMISQIAFNHLYESGFRNMAFCNIKANETNGWANERSRFFQESARQKDCNHFLFEQTKNYRNREELIQKISTWLQNLPKPCGLMAANDSRARIVLEACRKSTIRVPEDLAVIGVDDDPLMCELSNPPLSSIIQGTDQLGYEACKLLDRMMDGKMNIKSKVIPPRGIKIRHSSDVIALNDKLISEAITFIRKNAYSGIQVEDVSRFSQISRSTLEKKFKRELNQTVHETITTVKFKKACELLKESSLSIQDISFKCGFNTVQYMSKVIKDRTGKTPKSIRNSFN